jgi:hypothetical protein
MPAEINLVALGGRLNANPILFGNLNSTVCGHDGVSKDMCRFSARRIN